MQFSEEMNEIIVHTLCGLKLNDTLQQTEQSHIAIHIELHVEALHIHHTMVQFQSIRRFFHYLFALGVRIAMIRDQFRFEFSWYLIVSAGISPTHSISISVNDLHYDASPRLLFQGRDFVTL